MKALPEHVDQKIVQGLQARVHLTVIGLVKVLDEVAETDGWTVDGEVSAVKGSEWEEGLG